MICAGSLVVVNGVALLFVANLGYCIGFQTGHVAQNLMWANYCGRMHLGAIAGISLPVTIGIGAFAFPAIGILRDLVGSYTSAWTIAFAALVLASITLNTVKPPTNEPVG